MKKGKHGGEMINKNMRGTEEGCTFSENICWPAIILDASHILAHVIFTTALMEIFFPFYRPGKVNHVKVKRFTQHRIMSNL